MKKFLIVLLTILLLLTSCEIITKQNKSQRNVYFISLALNYKETGAKELNATISDQKSVFDEIKFLSYSSSSPFSYYLITEDGKNLKVNDNGIITNEILDFTQSSHLIKEILLSKLSNYSSRMDENDLLIFHYSGHGDNDGGLVYHIKNNSYKDYKISTNDITSSIKGNKGTKLLFLDSCYSGAFYDDIANEYDKNSIKDLFEEAQTRRNIYALTAASSNEEAWEEYGFGRLTRIFLETLGYNTNTLTPGKKFKTLWYSDLITQIQKNININYSTKKQSPQGNEIKDFILF